MSVQSTRLDDELHGSKDNTHSLLKILCKQNVGLNICHINAQSLLKKIDEFRLIFVNSDIDIICVSETWFKKTLPSSLVALKGYKLFRHDRETHGGGVAMFIRESIKCKCISKSNTTSQIEYIFVELCGSQKLLVGTVYRPDKRVPFESFINSICNICLPYSNIIVTGDFNSNALAETDLTNEMRCLGLSLVNSIYPTHFQGISSTLLDLFFVEDVRNVLLFDQLSVPVFSKHDLVFLKYNFQLTESENEKWYRDFKNIDLHLLNADLVNINWDQIFFMTNIDDQCCLIESNIRNLFNKHVPLKKRLVKFCDTPWFNDDIKSEINKRNLAYRKWKRYRTPEFKNAYVTLRKKVILMIKEAKAQFYERKFSGAINTKATWKIIKDIGIGKTDHTDSNIEDLDALNREFVKSNNCENSQSSSVINSVCGSQDNVVASTSVINSSCDNQDSGAIFSFNSFSFRCVDPQEVLESVFRIKSAAMAFDDIHPNFIKIIIFEILPFLTYLFNSIITYSIFPSHWKHAKVIPIPKANNELRPISILPFFSKVLEDIMNKQIRAYCLENNLLTEKQSGFRANRGCITALIDVSEDIRSDVDKGKYVFLVLLDHSKAFNTVDPIIATNKLKNLFNFSNNATKLMSSYLHERTQSVYLNGRISAPLPIKKGVPQGSILGPLIFSLYINEFPKIIDDCNVHMYADDIQVYLSCNRTDILNCVHKLNSIMAKISLWASNNSLQINPSKSKCIIIHKKCFSTENVPQIMLNNQRVEYVTSAKNLGLIFNNTLSWNDHINIAVGRAYGMLRSLWATQFFTPLHIRMLLAKTYILPTLMYGCEIYANCDALRKQKLNVLFNDITRYVYGLKRYDHVSEYAKTIFGISFDNYLKLRALIMLHKIIFTQEPTYLSSRLTFSRSARNNNLINVRHKTLISERQFFVFTTRLWNQLSSDLQRTCNATRFKGLVLRYFQLKESNLQL